jgi:hypothetical protein
VSDQKNLPKTIKIVMDNNYPPYVFLDGKGNLQGILIDQWRLWEQKTGIRTLVSGMDWDEALNRMEAGEFDVIDTIFLNEQRAQVYDFSKPYTKIDVSIFFHKSISGISGYEFALVKTHPVVGYDILKDVEFPWSVADIIVQHHERMDGSGYPYGVQGEAILPEARILAVADIVEAVASHRPYRPARSIDAALEIINSGRGNLYDPAVVDTCVRLFRGKGYHLKES